MRSAIQIAIGAGNLWLVIATHKVYLHTWHMQKTHDIALSTGFTCIHFRLL